VRQALWRSRRLGRSPLCLRHAAAQPLAPRAGRFFRAKGFSSWNEETARVAQLGDLNQAYPQQGLTEARNLD